jgi:hypothetical protein
VLKNLQHDVSIKLEPNRDDAVEPYVESLAHRYVEQPSVTGRSTVPMNDPVYNCSSGYYGMPPARPAIHPSGHAQTPNHNQVDIMRIRLGADVRTTVSSLIWSSYLDTDIQLRSCCATFPTKSIRSGHR